MLSQSEHEMLKRAGLTSLLLIDKSIENTRSEMKIFKRKYPEMYPSFEKACTAWIKVLCTHRGLLQWSGVKE